MRRVSQFLFQCCGWMLFFAIIHPTQAHSASPLLITEFMSSNKTTLSDEDRDHPDWIEIQNTSTTSVSLDGWSLILHTTRDQRWTFPATNLSSGHYLIVFASGKNRKAPGRPLHTDFRLPVQGGSLILAPPDSNISSAPVAIPPSVPQMTDVSYGLAPVSESFPLFTTNQPAFYRIPSNTPTEPDWFRPDASLAGWKSGRAAIGFERLPVTPPSLRGLWLTDVGPEWPEPRQSVYLRIPFLANRRSNIDRLILQLHYLDGFVAFLNGEEIASRNDPPDLAWISQATRSRSPGEAFVTERIELSGETLRHLQNGENVLCIQGLLTATPHSQFVLAPTLMASTQIGFTEVYRYQTIPSPGGPNGLGSTDLGPAVQPVFPPPSSIGPTESILISVKAAPTFAPIQSLQLHYRVMFGPETVIPLHDDGVLEDPLRGDGVYSAQIPGNIASPGQMIRWHIEATDTRGISTRIPAFLNPTASPQHFGTVVSPGSISSPLPVLHWFVADPMAAATSGGTRASLHYRGKFYDNVAVHIRGNYSRGFPKVSYKFDFNPGELFEWDSAAQPAEEINLNTTWSDKSFMRPLLSWELYDLAGTPHPLCHPVRVQQNQQFHSVAHLVEEPDERFLQRLGLAPQGTLYKMFNGLERASGNQLVQPTQSNAQDLQELVDILATDSLARDIYLFDHVDIPQVINYLAASVLLHDNDIPAKNYFLYRDPEGADEWKMLPWDKDLTWGRNFFNGLNDVLWATNDSVLGASTLLASPSHPFFGDRFHQKIDARWNRLTDALYSQPDIRDMFLRRLRSLMDQILQSPDTPFHERILESRVAHWMRTLQSDAAMDVGRWQTYPPFQSLETATSALLRDYLQPRRRHLFQTHSETNFVYPGRAFIPEPTTRVRIAFGRVEVSPTSGNPEEEFIELQNLDGNAVDLSGWDLTGAVTHHFPPGTVLPGFGTLYLTPNPKAFRSRAESPRGGEGWFVQGNYQGHLSQSGGSLSLIHQGKTHASYSLPIKPSLAQQFLRITRIGFHPLAYDFTQPNQSQQLEYLELTYTGPEPLPLDQLRFTRGINFSFASSPIRTLFPSPDPSSQQRKVYVVANLTAFRARFGGIPQIAGEFTGQLDNQGEWLKLEESNGEVITEFFYDPSRHPLADGLGFSMVHNPLGPASEWQNPDSWQLSGYEGSGALTLNTNPRPPEVIISEILYNPTALQGTKAIELFSPVRADITGWFLTDDPDSPRKYRFPAATVLNPGQYLAIPESLFRQSQPGYPGFSLNSAGDGIFLFAADARGELLGYYHGVRFQGAPQGSSLTLQFPAASNAPPYWAFAFPPTLGRSNGPPRRPPIVISEIHFHPVPDPGLSADLQHDLEFIELHNPDPISHTLTLPGHPTNSWRIEGGISFSFPTSATLAPGKSLVIVHFHPQAEPQKLKRFRQHHGIEDDIDVVGPWEGKLTDAGEKIRLIQPILLPNGLVTESISDEVEYRSSFPWPETPRGWGASLSRKQPFGPGHLSGEWIATAPTPGRPHLDAPKPSILVPPQPSTNALHSSTEFRVLAVGDPPLRFQWQRNLVPIPHATRSSLILTNLMPNDTAEFAVLVMNDAGSTLTTNVHLHIRPSPLIVSQPQGFSAPTGVSTNLSITAFGAGNLSFRWFRNGLPNRSSESSTFPLPSLSPSDAGFYFAEVSDAYGITFTRPAEVITLLPPSIRQNPASLIVRVGDSFQLNCLASGTAPLGYRWRNGPFTLPQSTSATLTITNAQLYDTGDYFVIITNAANPRPGVASAIARILVVIDSDGDHIPDAWEQLYRLNPNNPADAAADPDGDGFTNLEEFLAGTHPRNSQDFLRIHSITRLFSTNPTPFVSLSFQMISNRTYQIQTRPSTHPDLSWSNWLTFPGRITNAFNEILDDSTQGSESRLYRLVIPGP